MFYYLVRIDLESLKTELVERESTLPETLLDESEAFSVINKEFGYTVLAFKDEVVFNGPREKGLTPVPYKDVFPIFEAVNIFIHGKPLSRSEFKFMYD